jgi:caffeoyl-CoA O-methyltransferase
LAKPFALEIVDPLALAYADFITAQEEQGEDALLNEIALSSKLHPEGHMLSGHVQGKFLQLISQISRPKRILEIGTFLGYSALCLVKGLENDGFLHTIELRAQDAEKARENFLRSNASDKIILHVGNALDILPALEKETWDLVFLDADKTGYETYYRILLPKMRSGGLMIADNVLFHGQVLNEKISGKNAMAVASFNELVRLDRSVDKVLLTIRDGLLLIRKK